MPDAAISLETLLLADSELSSLPEIYIRVSDLLDNDNSTSAQIGQVVETDPALTTRILRMVNSAFYGFPSTISTISQSVTILGRDRLRQILVGSVLGGVFGKVDNKVLSMEDFWQHSVKTAILARQLARNSSVAELADSLFTAGLLHQIGRLIIAQKLPDQAQQIQQAAREMEDSDLCNLENRLLSFNHCDVGAAFINKWGLPELLSDVAKYYPRPQATERNLESVRLVYMASNLAFMVDPIEQEEVEFALEDIDAWQQSGLSPALITDACRIANDQVFEVMESFGMGQMRIELDE